MHEVNAVGPSTINISFYLNNPSIIQSNNHLKLCIDSLRQGAPLRAMATSFALIQGVLSPRALSTEQALFLPKSFISYHLKQGLVIVTWGTPRCTHKEMACHFDQENETYSISLLRAQENVVSIWYFKSDF